MSGKNIEELARKFQAGEELHLCEKAVLARNRHELPEPVQVQLMQQLEAETFQPGELSKSQRKRRRRQERKQQQAE